MEVSNQTCDRLNNQVKKLSQFTELMPLIINFIDYKRKIYIEALDKIYIMTNKTDYEQVAYEKSSGKITRYHNSTLTYVFSLQKELEDEASELSKRKKVFCKSYKTDDFKPHEFHIKLKEVSRINDLLITIRRTFDKIRNLMSLLQKFFYDGKIYLSPITVIDMYITNVIPSSEESIKKMKEIKEEMFRDIDKEYQELPHIDYPREED